MDAPNSLRQGRNKIVKFGALGNQNLLIQICRWLRKAEGPSTSLCVTTCLPAEPQALVMIICSCNSSNACATHCRGAMSRFKLQDGREDPTPTTHSCDSATPQRISFQDVQFCGNSPCLPFACFPMLRLLPMLPLSQQPGTKALVAQP